MVFELVDLDLFHEFSFCGFAVGVVCDCLSQLDGFLGEEEVLSAYLVAVVVVFADPYSFLLAFGDGSDDEASGFLGCSFE